jgi:hypothetical protein
MVHMGCHCAFNITSQVQTWSIVEQEECNVIVLCKREKTLNYIVGREALVE